MDILALECRQDQKDELVAELWEAGTQGIVEQDGEGALCTLRAFFEKRFDESPWARFGARWEYIPDRDWVAVSREQWQPQLVGERFFLVEAWSDTPTPAGRIRLDMRPGMACGTGWGPATQLALEAMERALAPGAAVLDVGTGSGILAVAAARLGAGRIYACDIDPEAAVEAAGRFRDELIEVGLFAGSVRALRSRSVDFLVANINAETLVELRDEFRRILKPEGHVALSGFPERHLERVRAAFGGRGSVLERDEWRAIWW